MNKIKTILTISLSVVCFQVQAETVDDIRAKLFASTGGNVTQEATDFERSQIIADPNGSQYSVSKPGYTGEWGSYPAMDMSNTYTNQRAVSQGKTVDDIRARLFASTGGNVTQEATDFYRKQIIADPNGSPYSVSTDGYTGVWGNYPAMDMSNTKFHQPTIKPFNSSYELQMPKK